MRLILARHGNTFAPGDPVVWTGSSNDLPLVLSGELQATACARALAGEGLIPNRILTGPLLRTTEFARIVADVLKFPGEIEIESRLMELDYGSWTGLTNEEVAARYGAEAQNRWNQASIWPEAADWGGSVNDIIAQVKELAGELVTVSRADDTILLVSSNGRIRYFLELRPGAFAEKVAAKNFKVKTGAYCVLEYSAGTWSVRSWNVQPAPA